MNKTLDYYKSLSYDVKISVFDTEDGLMVEACIPQLGEHAFTGIGETKDKAIESLNAIKEELFEDMMKNQIEIPEPEPKQEVNAKLLQALKRIKVICDSYETNLGDRWQDVRDTANEAIIEAEDNQDV